MPTPADPPGGAPPVARRPLPLAPRTAIHVGHRAALTLLGPLVTAAPSARGWRVSTWDAEQGLSLTLSRDDRHVLIELEPRDEALDCYARTERFNVCARPSFVGNGALTAEERALVDGVVRLIARREGALAPDDGPTPDVTRVREITVERVLVPEGRRRYYVNPYAGCMIGCSFCYVGPRAELSQRLDGAPPPRWGRWVDVKVNAPEVLAREVREHTPGLVRLSPILTDPYQAVESRHRVTRRSLEVLLGAGYSPMVLTRQSRVLADLPLLASTRRAAVGFSIPTDDDRLRRAVEPGADPIERRFEALTALHGAGVVTAVVIQPVLPMNAAALVERLAPLVRVVRVDHLHFGERVAERFAAAGIAHAAEPAFQRALVAELEERFRAAGVLVDEHDDLAGLLEPMIVPAAAHG